MPVLNALELCNGCGFEPMLASSAAGYCADCQMTTGLADCLHEPTDDGQACRFCGTPSTIDSPDETAAALTRALLAAGALLLDVVCDDSRKTYAGPAYVTFLAEGCQVFPAGEAEPVDHGADCTANLCPACSGPYLTPDLANDRRRPMA